MEFQNSEIEIADLPKAEAIELNPIDPAYKKVLFRQTLLGWGIVLLVAGIILYFIPLSSKLFWYSILFAAWLIISALSWLVTLKSFRHKAYAIREHDVIYRTGWLVQSVKVCPYNRMQHCSISAGIWERRVGLAAVHLYTAGASGADITIPGLKEATADALKELIIKKTTDRHATT